MSVKTNHNLAEPCWFLTFTCYKWLPLFELTNSYDLVYNGLEFISKRPQVQTLAFVIMPNHVHLLLYLEDITVDLNKMVSNGKRFMAYELIKRLNEQQRNDILLILRDGCSEIEKRKGQKHRAFEPSFDAKPVFNDKFLNQKLDYIHHNPVMGKWSLCSEFTDYPHSSAAFYLDDKPHGYLNIMDYRDYWYGEMRRNE